MRLSGLVIVNQTTIGNGEMLRKKYSRPSHQIDKEIRKAKDYDSSGK